MFTFFHGFVSPVDYLTSYRIAHVPRMPWKLVFHHLMAPCLEIVMEPLKLTSSGTTILWELFPLPQTKALRL